MDTFTTSSSRRSSKHRHQSAHGFCTVCGTTWPCWRGVGERQTRVRVYAPPLGASIAASSW